ncbi:MAG: Two component regulator three Y domain protein [Flavobacteriaceae bacterium]
MKNFYTILCLLIASISLHAQVPESELKALKDLYNATQGDQWKLSWAIDTPVTEWEGVTIVDNHVTEIRMLFNNLQGELPSSLNQLTKLKVLELSFNSITGKLPESLGNLSNLEVLALNGNSIEGNIPNSIGNLKQLKQLHLSSNQLSGELPASINFLENLEVFNVFQNKLTGDLPISLSRSRTIKEFIIAKNNFTNTAEISTILLSNSAGVNLQDKTLNSTGKSIIAIETSDDGN